MSTCDKATHNQRFIQMHNHNELCYKTINGDIMTDSHQLLLTFVDHTPTVLVVRERRREQQRAVCLMLLCDPTILHYTSRPKFCVRCRKQYRRLDIHLQFRAIMLQRTCAKSTRHDPFPVTACCQCQHR